MPSEDKLPGRPYRDRQRETDEVARKREALAKAARSLFEGARIFIEELDEHCWRVGAPSADYLFWPASGLWHHPDGRPGGGGPFGLLQAIRAGKPAPHSTDDVV